MCPELERVPDIFHLRIADTHPLLSEIFPCGKRTETLLKTALSTGIRSGTEMWKCMVRGGGHLRIADTAGCGASDEREMPLVM